MENIEKKLDKKEIKEDYVETDGDLLVRNCLYSLEVLLPLSTFGMIYTNTNHDIKSSLLGAGLSLAITVPACIALYNSYRLKNSK